MDTHFSYLVCPDCQSGIEKVHDTLHCIGCGHVFEIIEGIPNLLPSKISGEDVRSLQKFDQKYIYSDDEVAGYISHLEKEYVFSDGTVLERLPNTSGENFLELGCGGGISGVLMSKKGYRIFGIDYSLKGLLLSKKVFEHFGVEAHLVCGDIAHLPFKDNYFTVSYGGGTLEHLYDTQGAVHALFRVTKPGGACVNTVPVISLSTLTYRQLSGSIPDVPIIRDLYYFIHSRLLSGRFMHCGYEKAFLEAQLRLYHTLAGFDDVSIHKYNFVPALSHFPIWMRGFLRWIEQFRPFWNAVTVLARKS